MAYEFRCNDGHDGCRWKDSAATEEDLRPKIAKHAKDKHNVQDYTDTLWNLMRKTITKS